MKKNTLSKNDPALAHLRFIFMMSRLGPEYRAALAKAKRKNAKKSVNP